MSMNKVKELRDKLRLTQDQFAVKLGVAPYTLRRWEAGKNRPSPLAQQRLDAITYELEPEKIVSYTKAKQIKG